MISLTKRSRMIISCILAAINVVLASLIIFSMIKNNPNKLDELWNVGNGWIRLLGCLIVILLILMLTVLVIKMYGITREKLNIGIRCILAAVAFMIIAVLAIINSGAARLDAVFTMETSFENVEPDEIYEWEDPDVSDDGVAGIEKLEYSIGEDLLKLCATVKNYAGEEITFGEMRYSILTPSGKLYSGKAQTNVSNGRVIREGESSQCTFYVSIPRESGQYSVEVQLSYYDKDGELHLLNTIEKKEYGES